MAYKNSTFKAKISSMGFDMDFEAIVTVEAKENENGPRFIFEFTSPQSLKGLEVRIADSITEISLGGQQFASLELPEDKSIGLFQVSEMILPGEPITSIKSINGRECGFLHIEALTAVSTRSATVYIDPESGLPVKASTPDGSKHLMISVITSEV